MRMVEFWGLLYKRRCCLVYKKKNRIIKNYKWNKIWSRDGFPKVNFFFWILAHRKALTAENLGKRGIVGLLRCILCKEEEEIIVHVFTECKFTQKVWREVLKELKMNITLPTNWNEIFFSWNDFYQGSLNKNPYFSIAWDALPRFVCWKIWNARNKEIFEGKIDCFKKVSAATKNLWVDTLAIRGMKNIINEPLMVE